MSDQKSSISQKVVRTDKEWREELPPEVYHITRESGTERAFTGEYWDFHEKGLYRCACCGNELFDSEAKFDSGSGWPSFYKPTSEDMIEEEKDTNFGMSRMEVKCSKCGAHLGHVFEDGPKPTGLRYCINSASLDFVARRP